MLDTSACSKITNVAYSLPLKDLLDNQWKCKCAIFRESLVFKIYKNSHFYVNLYKIVNVLKFNISVMIKSKIN